MMFKICLVSVLVVLMVSQARAAGNPQDQESPQGPPSTRLLSFISILNGYYSNVGEVSDQIKHKKRVPQDVVNVTMLPVYVPALDPALTFYFEESDNHRVFRMHILGISEDEEGVINLVPMSFTDPGQHKPNTFDPAILQDLTLSDFDVLPERCNFQFLQLEEDVFMGSYPDCVSKDPLGKSAFYAMTITCHTFSVLTSSPYSREQPSRVPYDHVQIYRYPLLPYMLEGAEDFQDPCGN